MKLDTVRLRRKDRQYGCKNRSFTQFFSKNCGFQRQSLWAHSAECKTSLKLGTVSCSGWLLDYDFITRQSFVLTHSFVKENQNILSNFPQIVEFQRVKPLDAHRRVKTDKTVKENGQRKLSVFCYRLFL